ncbi:MAG: Ig-like domain-containing protein [Pseudomonadota bacterium]
MYLNVIKPSFRLLTLLAASLVLVGCGQGSGPEPVAGTPQPPQTGVLVDAPVSGVAWSASGGASGVTTTAGEFQYLPLETITFSIGDIMLGSVAGAPFVTVVELTNSVSPTQQAAVNQLVFLQSIDEDGDLSNGIQVSATATANAGGVTLDFTADDFPMQVATVVETLMGAGAEVRSESEALNHFYNTYAEMGGTDTFGFLFPGYPPVGGGNDTFELVFADEFESGSVPDPTKWTLETGYGPNNDGWGNNEWQLYTTSPDNVRVEEGNLVIQARCDTPPCGSRDGTVTSGKINTLNKFNFRYGKVQARIKPPVGVGAWPAFWALGANHPVIGWPRSGEIDFMEMHNAISNNRTTHSTIHWCDETIQAPAQCTFPDGWRFDSQTREFATSLGDDFHIWEADWNEDRITMSIDGITYFTRNIQPSTMEEFLREFYMILNVAMGGTLGSNSQPPSGLETWPQTMLVDYVRVFQNVGDSSGGSQVIDFEEAPENYDFGPSGGFGGGAAAVIPNPVAEGINTSAQVGRMLKFNGELFAGSKLTLSSPIAVPSGSAFTMKVWSPREVDVLFKLEGESEAEREVTHTGSGWEELTFDFGSTSLTAEAITLIFDNGTAGDAEGDPDNWTFYFDDITFTPSSGGGSPGGDATFPIDFEEAPESYNFGIDGGFGGGAAAVIDNPVADANNNSAQVARMLKFSGEVFAGSLLELPTPLDVVSGSSFTMNVWSPREVMVLFKLEGEQEIELNVPHGGTGWETLTFDFGSFAGTAEGITFIFDLGVVGDATGDPDNWTFYFDDIVYLPGDDGGAGGGDTDDFGGDFEAPASTYDFGPDGGFGGGAAEVISNPVPGGINTSAQVVQMRKFMADDFGGAKWNLPTPLDVMAGSTFTMKVWSPRAVMVLLKLEGPTEAEINLPHSGSGWELLTYDFSAFSGMVEGITVIFDLGVVGDAGGDPDNWTFYYDDITLIPPDDGGGMGGGLAQIDLPITFDDASVDYTVTDFGSPVANMTTIVVDPENASNMVASTTKPMGTPVWSGTTMSTTDGLASAIPFTANDTTIGMRVYSPAAGLPVRLKAENVVSGVIGVETEVLTTVANQWETLVFDFANPVAGTPALDLNTSYRSLSVFFNFGTSGDDAGSLTFLWDDVEFGVQPAGDTTAPTLTALTIASNNTAADQAQSGNTVTLSITSDEPIGAPTVTIGGGAADSVTGADASWMASRVLPAGTAQGPVAFTVDYADLAGNAGVTATQVTDASAVNFDSVAPTVAITGLDAALNSLDPVTLTFTFSEDVTGFDASDIVAINATVANVASVDPATYTADITPVAQGALTVNVAAGATQDAAGNDSAAATEAASTIDTVAPSVSITGLAADFATLDPIALTIQFSEAVNGFDVTDIAVTNGVASNFVLVDAANYTVDVTPDGGGDLTVAVTAGAAQDAAGNGNLFADAGSLIDGVAPTVSIDGAPTEFTSLTAISLTVQFSEAVSGFTAVDVQATNGAVNTLTAVDADTYTLDVTPTGVGDLLIDVAANVAQDGVGNGNTAATTVTITNNLDTDAPLLTAISIASNNADTALATVGDVVSITMTANENITAPTVTINGVAADSVTGADDTWSATRVMTGGDAEGVVAFTIDFADIDGNDGPQSTVTTDGSSVTFDLAPPTLTTVSMVSDNADTTLAKAGDTVTISITASEDIAEPTVTIAGSAASVTGSGDTWSASRALLVTDVEGAVAFTIDFVDANGVAGTQVSATTDASSVEFDRTAPTLAITGLGANFTSLDPITATFTFSEEVSGFALADIDVTNGTAGSFATTDAATYTASITPTGGDLVVSVSADAAADAAGNGSAGATETVLSQITEWSLVWSDDFESGALEGANWTARTDADCPAPCSGQQSYATANVSVAGGVLSIEAQQNAGPSYVSGFVDSRGKQELTYGRVEIDARMPGTPGSAPALMLLPASDTYGAWPLSGEIDIATAPDLGGGNADVEQSLHYGLPVPENTTTTGTYTSPTAPDTAFITYAIEWEKGEVRWFVDDVHVLTQTSGNWYTYAEDADGVFEVGAGAAPFDHAFYVAIGFGVNDNAGGGTFPLTLQVDEVRVYECANPTDPMAGTGCSTGDPGVTPVVAPNAPATAMLEVYTDAPATVSLDGVDNTLVPASSGGVTASDTNVDDGGNTIWRVNVSGSGSVSMNSQDFSADPLVESGFNLSGADAAGELIFDMRVNSATVGTTLAARLDSGSGNGGSVAIPLPGDTNWNTYSAKIADMLGNQTGTGLNLEQVIALFGLDVASGTAEIDVDNIRVKVACRDAGTCDPAALPTDVFYAQDFEAMTPAQNAVPNDLSEDGWLVGANVFDPGGTFLFNYFSFPSPNGGAAFSAVVDGQGGAPQGLNSMSVYNDYNNTGAHDVGNRVEANVFQEFTITADDVGKTFYFSFDAKRGNINDATECAATTNPPCDSTAQAFLKVINPSAGFSETTSDTEDTTNLTTTWDRYTLVVDVTDASFIGQLLQFGFLNNASNYEPSGVFYDNLEVRTSQ